MRDYPEGNQGNADAAKDVGAVRPYEAVMVAVVVAVVLGAVFLMVSDQETEAEAAPDTGQPRTAGSTVTGDETALSAVVDGGGVVDVTPSSTPATTALTTPATSARSTSPATQPQASTTATTASTTTTATTATTAVSSPSSTEGGSSRTVTVSGTLDEVMTDCVSHLSLDGAGKVIEGGPVLCDGGSFIVVDGTRIQTSSGFVPGDLAFDKHEPELRPGQRVTVIAVSEIDGGPLGLRCDTCGIDPG